MKILIDTNVYIDFLRTGKFEELIQGLYTFRSRDIFFSSVVISELFQGCLDAQGQKNVEALVKPFEKVGRLVTPSHQDWVDTGLLLAQLRKKKKISKQKLRSLKNDVLITLSAKKVGAQVYTSNKKDFELIGSVKTCSFVAV